MNKKPAFTILEVLIALGIIGILATFGLKAVFQNDKGIRHLYSSTYHSLDTALYNATHYPTLPDPFVDTEELEGGEVVTLEGRNTGNGATIQADEGTERLCNMLTEYINPITQGTCSRTRLVSDVADDAEFTDDNVQFTSTNGMRYFISRRLPYDGIGGPRALQNGDTRFFIIYVDVNGRRFPNSLEYRSESDNNRRIRSRDPDIFAFAALDTGRVVPLGPPEFDGRFMLARIRYYDKENEESTAELNIRYSYPSQPYYLMKAQAWGYYNVNSNVADTDIIEESPLSYNGYIKSKLDPDTRIYSFVSNDENLPEGQRYFNANGQVRKVPATSNIRSGNVSEGGFGCVPLDDEECEVIIDKYVY